jgi:Protein kinase domain.
MNKMDKNLSIKDFRLLSVIGKGSYAKVLLVKRNSTGQVMALKSLKKELIEKRKQEQHVREEKDILVSAYEY